MINNHEDASAEQQANYELGYDCELTYHFRFKNKLTKDIKNKIAKRRTLQQLVKFVVGISSRDSYVWCDVPFVGD